MADSGKIMKVEVDYSDTVDKSLPEYQEMARVSFSTMRCTCSLIRAHYSKWAPFGIMCTFQSGKVKEALEGLLGLEKLTRMVSFLARKMSVIVILILRFTVYSWEREGHWEPFDTIQNVLFLCYAAQS